MTTATTSRKPTAAPRSKRRRTFTCVVERRTPEDTRASLRRACEARAVDYDEVRAETIDPRRAPLPPGQLLYTPGTSLAADRAERQLWQPGVVTFHRPPATPFTLTLEPHTAFARAGLPVPRSVWVSTGDRVALGKLVDHVGGLPAVLRLDGGEDGAGVLRADNLASLYAMVDLLLGRGLSPRLVSHVPDATHFRVIVVGERAVTAYLNPVKPDDFRSAPSERPEDYGLAPTPELAALAVAAAHVVGTAFAGVDILAQPGGHLFLLEANFPCYFPQAESFGAADVAGAMLDHLLASVA